MAISDSWSAPGAMLSRCVGEDEGAVLAKPRKSGTMTIIMKPDTSFWSLKAVLRIWRGRKSVLWWSGTRAGQAVGVAHLHPSWCREEVLSFICSWACPRQTFFFSCGVGEAWRTRALFDAWGRP